VTSELSPMSPGRLVSYDELGAHRHLVISERLRTRRRDLGLTQKEVVARLRRIGVATTNKALSSLEHGAGLDVCKLPELARALDCSLTYLVGLNDDPASWEPDFENWPGRRPSRERTARALTPGRKMPPGAGPHILGPL
jgi:transcriptional regulator with XRE-family HTH domain